MSADPPKLQSDGLDISKPEHNALLLASALKTCMLNVVEQAKSFIKDAVDVEPEIRDEVEKLVNVVMYANTLDVCNLCDKLHRTVVNLPPSLFQVLHQAKKELIRDRAQQSHQQLTEANRGLSELREQERKCLTDVNEISRKRVDEVTRIALLYESDSETKNPLNPVAASRRSQAAAVRPILMKKQRNQNATIRLRLNDKQAKVQPSLVMQKYGFGL